MSKSNIRSSTNVSYNPEYFQGTPTHKKLSYQIENNKNKWFSKSNTPSKTLQQESLTPGIQCSIIVYQSCACIRWWLLNGLKWHASFNKGRAVNVYSTPRPSNLLHSKLRISQYIARYVQRFLAVYFSSYTTFGIGFFIDIVFGWLDVGLDYIN